MSADDLRINLWNLQNNITAFNVVDLKPQNIEELPSAVTGKWSVRRACHLYEFRLGVPPPIIVVEPRFSDQDVTPVVR